MEPKRNKIAFVWYWDQAEETYPNWRDGHRAAIEEIGKTNDVTWFLGKKIPDPNENWDFILFWDDSNSSFFDVIDQYKCRKGLCLTTDPHNIENLFKLDVVFVESDPVFNAVRAHGIRTIKAFGTDTDFFHPEEREKDIEYFYPATFSPWKRQSDIAYLGDKLLCVGTMQPDGQREYDACVKTGVKIELGYFPVEKIRNYYWRSKQVIIPAVHGSERTVLESMACGVWPVVTNEINVRTQSYIKEYMNAKALKKNLTPREFVVEHYSHKLFAQSLMKGINV